MSGSEGPSWDLFNTPLMFKQAGTSSAAAAHAAAEAKLNQTHRVIWRALKAEPRTPDQLAADLKLVLNTCRARCTELVKRGWAKRTGETRPTDAGRPADVLSAVIRAPRDGEDSPDLFTEAAPVAHSSRETVSPQTYPQQSPEAGQDFRQNTEQAAHGASAGTTRMGTDHDQAETQMAQQSLT